MTHIEARQILSLIYKVPNKKKISPIGETSFSILAGEVKICDSKSKILGVEGGEDINILLGIEVIALHNQY